jgi:pimeloyl-ACP methyl ester carboxylesterase
MRTRPALTALALLLLAAPPAFAQEPAQPAAPADAAPAPLWTYGEAGVEPVEVKPRPCRVPELEEDVLCGVLPVWEDREAKKGRKIGINVVILPAKDPQKKKPDPIFFFGGGPGQGIAQSAPGFADADLRQERDVVLADQRGTGGSNPLDCQLYGDPLDARQAAGPLFPPDAVRACKEKLEKRADLRLYTTPISADDYEEVRRWLGYEKVNLNGGSYGTRMAEAYWKRHPEPVRSVVLAGVAPLDEHLPLHHAYAGQRALDLLFAECAETPACKEKYPRIQKDLAAVMKQVERGVKVKVKDPRTEETVEVVPDRGMVAEGLRYMMYGPGGAQLPYQIRKAAEGDLSVIVQTGIERRLDLDEVLAMGLLFSVTCAEDLPFIDDEEARRKTAGTLLGDYRIAQQKAVCEIWPRGKIPADTHEPVRDDAPALLLSGERDPVTPPEFADRVARHLPNALHLVAPRGSHGDFGDCTERIVRELVDRASFQGIDTSCIREVPATEWKLDEE